MKISTALFDLSAPDLASCPKWALPEFAFIGRSNVGKSSLINLLAGRNALAKVSVTPGKTKLLNFFVINDRWALVDLPGYGYANVSQKQRSEFNESVADYIEGRTNIFRVFVLIDSRIPPQRIDLDFLQWLVTTGKPFALIFTKIDKLSRGELDKAVAQFKKSIAPWCPEPPEIFSSSSTSKAGRTEILGSIAKILAENNHA